MTPFDLLADEFSPEIVSVAKERVIEGGNLATRSDLSRRVIKLALMLVRFMNPPEDLSEGETAILMGVTAPTLKKMRSEKQFITVINR